jgi:hypothetical protein
VPWKSSARRCSSLGRDRILPRPADSIVERAAGGDTLTELIGSLQQQHITFVFARLKGPMRQDLQGAGVLDLVGEDRLYPTVRAAVQAASAPPQPGEHAGTGERVDGESESDPP